MYAVSELKTVKMYYWTVFVKEKERKKNDASKRCINKKIIEEKSSSNKWEVSEWVNETHNTRQDPLTHSTQISSLWVSYSSLLSPESSIFFFKFPLLVRDFTVALIKPNNWVFWILRLSIVGAASAAPLSHSQLCASFSLFFRFIL